MRLMTKNKLVYGRGLNDANYNVYKYHWNGVVNKVIWRCPYYRRWTLMLQRCFSEGLHKKHPSYLGCKICNEWLVFSNFKAWMETQDWEGKELDKDIYGQELYSPDTCLMVRPDVNKFFRDVFSNKPSHGYCMAGGSYQVKITCKSIGICITKRFKKESDAKEFYLSKRNEIARDLIALEFGESKAKDIIAKSSWIK